MARRKVIIGLKKDLRCWEKKSGHPIKVTKGEGTQPIETRSKSAECTILIPRILKMYSNASKSTTEMLNQPRRSLMLRKTWCRRSQAQWLKRVEKAANQSRLEKLPEQRITLDIHTYSMEAKSKSRAFKIFLRYIFLRGISSPVALERVRTRRIHFIIHIKTKPLHPITTISLTFKHLLPVLLNIHTRTRWRIAQRLMTPIDCFQTMPNNRWKQIRLEYLLKWEQLNSNHENRILDSTWTDSKI